MSRFAPLVFMALVAGVVLEPVAILGTEAGVDRLGRDAQVATEAAVFRIFLNFCLLMMLAFATTDGTEPSEPGNDVPYVPNFTTTVLAAAGVALLAGADAVALLGKVGGIASIGARAVMAMFLARYIDWTMILAPFRDALGSRWPFRRKARARTKRPGSD